MQRPIDFETIMRTRRGFLTSSASGLGMIGLGSLLAQDGVIARSTAEAAAHPSVTHPLAPRPGHFPPRAKSCIFIFMLGAPSQVDLFDPKPKLNELDGQPLPESMTKNVRFAFIQKETATLMGTPRRFAKHGDCGMDFSELLPHLAGCADEVLMARSLHTDEFNHDTGELMMQCGVARFGLPTMGAWTTYGLGSESQNLPGYVVLSGGGAIPRADLTQSGFLPSIHAGTHFLSTGDPVLNLSSPPGLARQLQRKGLDALQTANQWQYRRQHDPEIASRIANYELAFRMQMAAPELMDLSQETTSTIEAYGMNRPEHPDTTVSGKHGNTMRSFARNCLLARRLVERGVRFVNILYGSWDHHEDLEKNLPYMSRVVDQPIAALIQDLKQRGLLDETMVVWGSEFGRTPLGENRPNFSKVTGRDHHPLAFTMLFAGGGMQGGKTYGTTDEIGWNIVDGPVHVNDLHATMLHCFGLDHMRLTHRFQGRDFRLTDVGGIVVDDWLS